MLTSFGNCFCALSIFCTVVIKWHKWIKIFIFWVYVPLLLTCSVSLPQWKIYFYNSNLNVLDRFFKCAIPGVVSVQKVFAIISQQYKWTSSKSVARRSNMTNHFQIFSYFWWPVSIVLFSITWFLPVPSW